MIHRWRTEVGGSRQTDRQVCLELGMRYAPPPHPTGYLRLRIAGIPRHKKRIHFLWRSCTELYFIIVSNTSGIHLLFGAWSKSIIDADLECNHDREPERRMWAMHRGYDKCMLRSVFWAS